MLKALLIDDEPLAHDVIIHHLSKRKDVTIVKQCYQAAEALAWLANNDVDLLFLDINMPQLSGIEMLRVMANPPQVIIISAYQEYAIEGFELDVTDYLLKPVKAERLNQAIDKVYQRTNTRASTRTKTLAEEVKEEAIFLKVDRSLKKFTLAEITLFEAYGNYVKLWQESNVTLVTSTLKNISEQLPSDSFTQVHKSFLVRNTAIMEFHTSTIGLENGRILNIGKSYKNAVEQMKRT